MDMGRTSRRGAMVIEGKMGAFQQDSVAKAQVIELKPGGGRGRVIDCHFRPNQFSLTRTNKWDDPKQQGSSSQPKSVISRPEYHGGQPMTLTLKLLFDTNEFPPGQHDVRQVTKQILDLMKPVDDKYNQKTKLKEPPDVEFRWGKLYTFTAVITSITQTFKLFKADGTPVRAELDVTFRQVKDDEDLKPQNPTSGGRERFNVHTVKEGETIDWIAYEEYGSSNAWRHLAAANNLDDPSRLLPGQRLVLAPLG